MHGANPNIVYPAEVLRYCWLIHTCHRKYNFRFWPNECFSDSRVWRHRTEFLPSKARNEGKLTIESLVGTRFYLFQTKRTTYEKVVQRWLAEAATIGSLAERCQCKHARFNVRARNAVSELKRWFSVLTRTCTWWTRTSRTARFRARNSFYRPTPVCSDEMNVHVVNWSECLHGTRKTAIFEIPFVETSFSYLILWREGDEFQWKIWILQLYA